MTGGAPRTGAANADGARARLVAFDLDGTLIDSRLDLAESANAVLEEAGCRSHSEEAIGRMVGDGAATLVARAFAAANCPQPPEALSRFLEIYNSRLLKHTRLYPGVDSTLQSLSQRHTLALLTNKPLAATHEILAGLGVADYFGGRVLGGDGPYPRKPDPAGLLALIAGCEATPGTAILVGDSVIDWRTAKAAAASCVLARYGFGFGGFPVGELTSTDRVIDHPQELLTFL